MPASTCNVLFLCTGNSARSILAEAITRHLSAGDGRFRAYSAGSMPKAEPHPLALEVLRNHGISTDGLRSKPWDAFDAPGAPTLDVVITVCDQAAAESCPVWPGRPTTAHWGMPDPAAAEGTDDEKRRAFFDAYIALRRRIELFAKLPFGALDKIALQERLREIGTR